MKTSAKKATILPYKLERVDPPLRGELAGINYGLVADLGTTTLGFHLVDLKEGKLQKEFFLPNPGRAFGADILNRVRVIIEETRKLEEIRGQLIDAINQGIYALTRNGFISPEQILCVNVIGNPIMIHIFYGIDPIPLSRAPFQISFKGNVTQPVEVFGLSINPKGVLMTPPLVSSFIGSDFICGILSSIEMNFPRPFLFFDLGTNAEIALVTHDRVFAASAAAGPAFEDFDMPFNFELLPGVIKHLKFSPPSHIEIESEGPPTKILASAKIDAVGILREMGLLDKTGLLGGENLEGNRTEQFLNKDDKGRRYFQMPPNIKITQEDIRNLQLAKAAIKTATELLLESANLRASQINAFLLAGTFGSSVFPSSAEKVGLLPPNSSRRAVPVGNSSGRGGIFYLLNREWRDIALEISQKTDVLKLTRNPKFKDLFLKSIEFP
ncbi:MAG: ASKHA domain-containing protein [Caldiserica bacterium]|jgi:uncharacterized 2Fe-2S/4Fe-4S cluster protein (DUF4445 family)|nr:ASKHA domain-containing protein [Caldisericota bacterium]